jgi:hypothetical protein
MRTTLTLFAGALALAPLATMGAACSSTTASGSAPPSNQQSGLLPPDAAAVGNTNPYGVPYPTQNIGYNARMGTTKGNQIENYKFIGYPNADVSKGLQTVALSDFYDPQEKQYKLIHLGVAAVWCTPCNEETDAIVPLVPSLAKQGVVFVQALDDGAVMGTPATVADLNDWIGNHMSNFTEMLDPNNMNLGPFFNAAAIPWNAIIDARSMEILTSGTGYSGDIQGDMNPWIQWVASNPPSYPAQ